MKQNNHILFGDLIYPETPEKTCFLKDGYLYIRDGKIEKVSTSLDQDHLSEYVYHDYRGKLILPGLSDIHLHSGQYPFHGLGSDCELLDWLKLHAFHEESKYLDLDYASKAYDIFVRDLRRSFTTRASIFATLHKEATLLLMQKLEDAGIPAFVGLVNMDRNAPENLIEPDTKEALKKTEDWIIESRKFSLVHPIITPRFVPTCTDEELEGLGNLAQKYDVPVQSHLDENPSEGAWVKELVPDSKNYAEVYERHHLFGNPSKTIMAHCIYNDADEIALLKKNGVYVAHCPECNMNIASGIAPIRHYLENGIHVGLGSDVSGGSTLNLFRGMEYAIQVSKMYFRYIDQSAKPLNTEEAFYLATLGGGSFFGKVGTFKEGYEGDCIVIDDSRLQTTLDLSLKDRLERLPYLIQENDLVYKLISGREISLD